MVQIEVVGVVNRDDIIAGGVQVSVGERPGRHVADTDDLASHLTTLIEAAVKP